MVSHPGSMNSNKNTTKRGTSPLEVGDHLYVNVWGDIRVISVLILMFYPLKLLSPPIVSQRKFLAMTSLLKSSHG